MKENTVSKYGVMLVILSATKEPEKPKSPDHDVHLAKYEKNTSLRRYWQCELVSSCAANYDR